MDLCNQPVDLHHLDHQLDDKFHYESVSHLKAKELNILYTLIMAE